MRHYPWRTTEDAFKVLIAEMMLRRTKADQVQNVYNELFKKYQSINSLASAADEKLVEILYPLGLHWRTSSFKKVAQAIKDKFNGSVPSQREELVTLPGVGEYVAGAVLSFAFNKKEWIVDANIVRFFKRYYGLKTTKEGRRDKHIIEIAKIYCSSTVPRKANLAILDFTSLICKPNKPNCSMCPISGNCKHSKNIIS
jgi:A/G-specific adenine glycosylase